MVLFLSFLNFPILIPILMDILHNFNIGNILDFTWVDYYLNEIIN